MTMASSTTKPVAMVRAMSDKLLRLKPARYITAKVPMSDSGTDKLGMMVAGILRKNSQITSTTSITASTNSNSTSFTEARIVVVRSVSATTSTPAGMSACSSGNKAWIRLTTSTTFAPGWRCTLSISAGCRFIQPPSLEFSAPDTSVVTSLRRTGAPFL